MFTIKKIRADHTIDFAAEELKEYLRMMMPERGDIAISYDPEAKDGFRLGLLQDFGLPFEGEDPVLDDVVHIDTDEKGGILAGSNARSVLFAVYRFLRLNGCRWLYPGVDGEYIPVADVRPTKYHKLADHRFRGHCNEGAESQQCMLETIDFYAKQEINVYMIEFDTPFTYYNYYYSHTYNENNRHPEPVTPENIKQWKRQCEAQIAKRGLQFHDMGHGWTAEPFGISSMEGWKAVEDESFLTEEQRSFLAEIDGVRGLWKGVPLNTNLCMSNPKVRTMMAEYIAKYAEAHQNVDYLHIWLADSSNNHCECEECQKLRPSDFYLMMLNELDEILTEKKLDTRLVFIAYYDTLFAPLQETIKNSKRFSLLYAPITRKYTESIHEDTVFPEAKEYVRNNFEKPRSAEDNIAHLRSWQKSWHGPCFSYEYHFWRHQFCDPGKMDLARRIYEDILGLKYAKLQGFVEDGSQRSFFPNGFPIHIYAEALVNRDVDFDKEAEDYFSHAYGKDWKKALDYMERVSRIFDMGFMEGEKSVNTKISKFYNPEHAKNLEGVRELAAIGKAIAKKHTVMPTRPQVISWRLLDLHTKYIPLIAEIMKEKALGFDECARVKMQEFFDEFGKYEQEFERYYDQKNDGKALQTINKAAGTVSHVGGDEIL